jgi:hypothetical protein
MFTANPALLDADVRPLSHFPAVRSSCMRLGGIFLNRDAEFET